MTTGQPLRVPSDRNKFNNDFMDNLRLQIKLNDQNLQANRLYTNTGQLPASTQMADTRTITEKLADVENLKSSIVADLKPIADPQFAFNIVDYVMKSPLNVDNTLLRFLAQNAQQIGQQLSKKYKFGIRGDANDCEIIVNFISDAYNTLKGSMQSIKGYINTTNQSSNAKNSILTSNDMDKIQSDLSDFIKRLRIMKVSPNNEQIIIPRVNNLIQVMNTVKNFLPNYSQLQDIISIVQEQDVLETPQNPAQYMNRQLVEYNQQKDLKDVFLILSDLPVHKTVQTLLSILYESVKNSNLTTFNQTITNLDGLFAPLTRQPNLGILQNFRNYYLQRSNHMEQLKSEQSIHKIQEMQQDNIRASKAQRVYVVNPEDDPVFTTDGINNNNVGHPPVNNAGQFLNRLNVPNPNLLQGQINQGRYLQQQAGIQVAQQVQQQQEQQQAQQQQYAQAIDQNLEEKAQFLRTTGSISAVALIAILDEIRKGYINNQEDLKDAVRRHQDIVNQHNPLFFNDIAYSDVGTKLPNEYQKLDFDPYSEMSQYGYNEDMYPKFEELPNLVPAYDIPKSDKVDSSHPNYIPKLKTFSEPEGWKEKSERSKDPHTSYVNSFMETYKPYNGQIPLDVFSVGGTDYVTVRDSKGNINGVPLRSYQSTNPHIPIDAINFIAGHGLNSVKKIKKGRGLRSDYRDFGINKINHKKLEDGILTVRRGTNSNYPDMPSKRISRKLQKIITHISGGGVPDFNEINNLENGEKDYLHKLISKSNLQERLSVPAPSKDQEEKDFHQFEVMKGEIMSGNDSKELVKKFKILILKLSKQNILPKNEVQELLQDLLSLGY